MIRHPLPWFAAFALWFGILWWLSSGVPAVPPPLQFTASDKVLHFGYFFGGAGLLSAALYLRYPAEAATRSRLWLSILIVSLVGALDEFHQSFIPMRSGNDPYDLAADILGAIAGSYAFLPFRKLFHKRTAGSTSLLNPVDDSQR